jgi:hypothetical protein
VQRGAGMLGGGGQQSASLSLSGVGRVEIGADLGLDAIAWRGPAAAVFPAQIIPHRLKLVEAHRSEITLVAERNVDQS